MDILIYALRLHISFMILMIILNKMGDLQWDYNADIAKLANIQPLPPVIEKLYRNFRSYFLRGWASASKEVDYRVITPSIPLNPMKTFLQYFGGGVIFYALNTL